MAIVLLVIAILFGPWVFQRFVLNPNRYKVARENFGAKFHALTAQEQIQFFCGIYGRAFVDAQNEYGRLCADINYPISANDRLAMQNVLRNAELFLSTAYNNPIVAFYKWFDGEFWDAWMRDAQSFDWKYMDSLTETYFQKRKEYASIFADALKKQKDGDTSPVDTKILVS